MIRGPTSCASVLFATIVGFGIAAACGGNEDSTPGAAGAACDTPDACYEDVDHEELQGDVLCLDRVPDGYCTHTCTRDEDCCAVEGECDGRPQVCAPFESTGMMMCFLSCEGIDEAQDDPDGYCREHAAESFTCRSTGGGSDNRKVCA